MNGKKIITAALLIFVAGSLGYMIARENCVCSVPRQDAPPAAVQPQTVPLSDIEQTTKSATHSLLFSRRCPLPDLPQT